MRDLDAFTVIFAAIVVCAFLALRSIWQSRSHSTKVRTIWTLIALIPIVGPVAWYFLGRERTRRR